MTKTANENMILTVIGKQDNDKVQSDWARSVTSTEQGVSLWEEVDYSRYEQWLETHPQPDGEEYADNTGEVEE